MDYSFWNSSYYCYCQDSVSASVAKGIWILKRLKVARKEKYMVIEWLYNAMHVKV